MLRRDVGNVIVTCTENYNDVYLICNVFSPETWKKETWKTLAYLACFIRSTLERLIYS